MDNINFEIDDEIKQDNEQDNNYVKYLRPTIESRSNNNLPPAQTDKPPISNKRTLSVNYDPYKSYNQSQKIATDGIAVNFDYLISAIGVLRILLIILETSGLVSAAALKTSFSVSNVTCMSSNTCFLSTQVQISYLFFSAFGIVLSFLIFLLILLNVIYKGSLVRLNWKIMFIIADILIATALFIVSIICSLRASDPLLAPNKSSFISAAIFGFLSTIVYAVLFILSQKHNT